MVWYLYEIFVSRYAEIMSIRKARIAEKFSLVQARIIHILLTGWLQSPCTHFGLLYDTDGATKHLTKIKSKWHTLSDADNLSMSRSKEAPCIYMYGL